MSTATASKTLELSDWDGIRAKLAKVGSRYGRAKVGNNLYAYDVGEFIRFELHGSGIARLYPDGMVEFNFAGWPTPTTMDVIEKILAKGSIRTPSTWDPNGTVLLPIVTFGGNPWLGWVQRPRRSKEEVHITVNVRSDFLEATTKLYSDDLDRWHKITDFVPNWKDYV